MVVEKRRQNHWVVGIGDLSDAAQNPIGAMHR